MSKNQSMSMSIKAISIILSLGLFACGNEGTVADRKAGDRGQNELLAMAMVEKNSHAEKRNDLGSGDPISEIQPPTNLVAVEVSCDSIALSWDPSPSYGIVAYRIYRDAIAIAAIVSLEFVDTGLAEGTSYQYNVSAVNHLGEESALSDSAIGETSMCHQ